MTKRATFVRFLLLCTTVAFVLSPHEAARSSLGSLLPNGWRVTPLGRLTPLGTLPLRMAEDPSGKWLAITNSGTGTQSLTIVGEAAGNVVDSRTLRATFYGLAFAPKGDAIFVSTAADGGVMKFGFDAAAGRIAAGGSPLRVADASEKNPWVAGLAVSRDGKTLYAADGGDNTLTALDASTGTKRWTATVGDQPYGVALSADGSRAYVSNWASSNVSVVNAANGKLVTSIATCGHPNAELARPDGRAVYVACANDDVVADISTFDNSVRLLQVGLYENVPEGATPNGFALSSNGVTLFVADADENVVTAVNVAVDLPPVPGVGIMRPRPGVYGAIPAGWYPTDVAVSQDGKQLFVLDGKGVSGHANPLYPHSSVLTRSQRTPGSDRYYVANFTTGDLERLPYPDDQLLIDGLKQARTNSPFRPAATQPAYTGRLEASAPSRARGAIEHVIYIIKENRTYDEVLGDDPRGNGDAKLAIFGHRITPNIHRLAADFVLLDNFYTDAEVSADGHSWGTAAYSTDYVTKLWPAAYSDRNRNYDFEQQGPASPAAGYIWDDALRHGLSVRDYGEFVAFGTYAAAFPARAATPSLEGHVDPTFAGFDTAVTDQARVDSWLREFHSYVAHRDLPRFEVMRLPNDHTAATRPGSHTPYAMLADNDYALGRIVDALSHSSYWDDTIVFVAEDDAQSGPDHVSDQRAEALMAGGWVKRGFVDHTHYTQSGMLRTIEWLLKLPPMSQFDAGGRLMSADIAARPDRRPWTASKPLVDLNARNPRNAADAQTSLRLDFTHPDAADPATTTAILYDFASKKSGREFVRLRLRSSRVSGRL